MPRKTAANIPLTHPPVAASMRPRPDATENPRDRAGNLPDLLLASMRPRPDATENSTFFSRAMLLLRLQ